MSNLPVSGGFSLTPQSLQEAMQMAELMANSDMVPKDYQGKPGNVLVAVQMGAELGLKPVQSLQNIAVVNGRPSIWGDGMRALIMSAPDLVDIKDDFDNGAMMATCTITRNINGNHVQFTGEFTKADAEKANLLDRNTWKSYPKKMLEWRAFGFAARKAYADRLRGISLAEEAQDISVNRQERDITPAKSKAERQLIADKPEYPSSQFDTNFPKWEAAIESGKTTADQLIAKIESKGTLTADQKSSIISIEKGE